MKQLMKPMEANPMRLLAGACSLVLTLGLAQPSVAQQTAKVSALPTQFVLAASAQTPTATAKPIAEEEEESPKPSKPGHEGVKVHGHWVLQVKNADGSLGDRREFDNSLVTTNNPNSGGFGTSSGSQLMVAMLSGNFTAGDPAIGFVQGDVTGEPSTFCSIFNIAAGQTFCYVFTSTNSLWNMAPKPSSHPVGYVSSSLGLTSSAIFTPSPAIVLSGNYTVPAGLTSIAAVQSLYGFCVPGIAFTSSSPYDSGSGGLENSASFRNADIAPLNCIVSNPALSGSDGLTFAALTSTAVTSNVSGTPVPTPLAVTPGQVVQVTVTLSFS